MPVSSSLRLHSVTSTRRAWPRRYATVFLLCWFLGHATEANATLDRGSGYSHKSDGCLDQKSDYADPITAAITGKAVDTASRMQAILALLVRWPNRLIDESNYYFDHGACTANNVDGADKPNVTAVPPEYVKKNRWHVRGRHQGGHDSGHNWVVLTPHRDVWIDEYYDIDARKTRCQGKSVAVLGDPDGKHYVHRNTRDGSGYDRGREALIDRLQPYYQSRVYWGNSARIRQCNTQDAWNNGYVAYFRIGR